MIGKIELKVTMETKKKRKKKCKKKDKRKPLSLDIIAINFMAAIDLAIKTKLVDPFDKCLEHKMFCNFNSLMILSFLLFSLFTNM